MYPSSPWASPQPRGHERLGGDKQALLVCGALCGLPIACGDVLHRVQHGLQTTLRGARSAPKPLVCRTEPQWAGTLSSAFNVTYTHSGRWDSNPRRPAWEAGILPLNYARKRAGRPARTFDERRSACAGLHANPNCNCSAEAEQAIKRSAGATVARRLIGGHRLLDR